MRVIEVLNKYLNPYAYRFFIKPKNIWYEYVFYIYYLSVINIFSTVYAFSVR